MVHVQHVTCACVHESTDLHEEVCGRSTEAHRHRHTTTTNGLQASRHTHSVVCPMVQAELMPAMKPATLGTKLLPWANQAWAGSLT